MAKDIDFSLPLPIELRIGAIFSLQLLKKSLLAFIVR